MTYGDVVKEKTPEELAKACSIVNVLRERERCAKIAEDMFTSLVTGNAAGKVIAAAIRAQSEDFTTVGEMMEGKQDA